MMKNRYQVLINGDNIKTKGLTLKMFNESVRKWVLYRHEEEEKPIAKEGDGKIVKIFRGGILFFDSEN